MPDPRLISADTARRFLAIRHLLTPPRSLSPGSQSVTRVFERLGSIQFDPLGIAGRNHDLVLAARIDGYRPEVTDALLYRDRVLFETWNKMLCLLPTAELPYYRIAWERGGRFHERETFPEHREAVDAILARIRNEGPLSALDIEHGGDIEWYWRKTNRSRAMLEALWESGVIGIQRRVGNRRYYDLIERLYPADLLARRPPEHEQFRHKMLSIFRAHGLASVSGPAEIWYGVSVRDENGKRMFAPVRAGILPGLVEADEIRPVQIEGVRGTRYVLAADGAMLDAAEQEVETGRPPGDQSPGAAFIAPLDSLVWDRPFLRALYGFDYVWEVYVPEAKRRWGYYVLPIHFGDRFVGRIEPRIERDAKGRRIVRIVGLWWEAGFRPRQADGFVPAMRDALAAYVRFADARALEWAPPLAAARRLFGTGAASRRRASRSEKVSRAA